MVDALKTLKTVLLSGSVGGLTGKILGTLMPSFCFQAVMSRQEGYGPFCTISFDCDFPRDIKSIPKVLELLKRHDVFASFACVGQWIRRFPDEHRLIVDAGCEMVNHTETHPNLFHPEYDYACGEGLSKERFNEISFERRQEEIFRGHETFIEVLGIEPSGFRAPHFGALHKEDVYPLLGQLSYSYSSSTVASSSPSCGLPYLTTGSIWEFPLSPCPRHPFGVFDSWHALGKHGASHSAPGDLSHLFKELCENVLRTGGYANVYFDPYDLLHSGELERILEYVKSTQLEVIGYEKLISKISRETPVSI